MIRETWYILNCSKGKEQQVKEDIIAAFNNSPYKNKLKEIKIIWKKVKNRSGTESLQNVFPGYIYIHIDLDNNTWFLVRNVTNVYSFIGSTGSRTKPIALTYNEVKRLKQDEDLYKNQAALYDLKFEPGNTVIIKKHSIFKNQKGIITAVNLNTGIVSIDVTFMNKKQKINLDYTDITKG